MRRLKVVPEEKIKAVESVLAGTCSLREAAERNNVHHSSVEKWVNLYKTFGPEGVWGSKKNQKYSDEMKRDAVYAYMSSQRSLHSICKEYKIRSISQIQYWIARHEEAGQDEK